MSFASPVTSLLRRAPGPLDASPGHGRHAIVAHVDRWFVASAGTPAARTALIVVDVDLDEALPIVAHAPVLSLVAAEGPTGRPATEPAAADEADDAAADRRARLGRSVARAIGVQVRPGDAVARIDTGRFAVLRAGLTAGGARAEAAAMARGIEDALVGRPEGFGVRVTAGAVALAGDEPRAGASALGAVTAAMLQGKLLTDDRVVVVVAPAA